MRNLFLIGIVLSIFLTDFAWAKRVKKAPSPAPTIAPKGDMEDVSAPGKSKSTDGDDSDTVPRAGISGPGLLEDAGRAPGLGEPGKPGGPGGPGGPGSPGGPHSVGTQNYIGGP